VAQAISIREIKDDLSVVAICLGLVFSFAWYCANRGSKQWQQNCEFHADLLEDDVTGPLYKTVIRQPKPTRFIEKNKTLVSGPGSFSVSKVNQIVSLFVTALWGRPIIPLITFT
jgi:hypothetical protein